MEFYESCEQTALEARLEWEAHMETPAGRMEWLRWELSRIQDELSQLEAAEAVTEALEAAPADLHGSPWFRSLEAVREQRVIAAQDKALAHGWKWFFAGDHGMDMTRLGRDGKRRRILVHNDGSVSSEGQP